MLVKITCPKCNTDGSFSLADPSYDGPYKCWKCRELFLIKMSKTKLESIESITEEEFNQQQEIQRMKNKFRKEQ